jgi:hypothetical protein
MRRVSLGKLADQPQNLVLRLLQREDLHQLNRQHVAGAGLSVERERHLEAVP